MILSKYLILLNSSLLFIYPYILFIFHVFQVRPNTPILQQGMQVLQIIHGTPQGYQSTPTQLVTRTQLFGNQQIQIAASKPTKQPPQILPKPPNQQTNTSQQKSQRVTTTITNQV